MEEPRAHHARASMRAERGATLVEYVGLGAVSTMLVSGIAAALDSAVGDRISSTIVEHLLAAIATGK